MAPAVADKTEAQWEAESDARTIAEARAIKLDGPRLRRAQKAARKMVAEEQEKLSGLRQVAGGRSKKA